jgi:hypothetical protein
MAIVIGAIVASGASAAAQGTEKPTAPASPAGAKPANATNAAAHAGAIVQVAGEIVLGIGEVPLGAIVVASTVTSDIPAPKGDELAARIATLVAGRFGVAKAHPQPAALAVARGVSGRAASLVYLQLEISKGALRVTADLYPVVSNGWERLRNPVPGPRAHAFATAPLDAEVRGFLTPVLLERAAVHKIKHEEGEVLAVGCGDLDGDGGLELVLVSRARVAIAKIRAGKLVVERAAAWTTIASRAAVPMRDALASVVVSPPGHRGEIFLGTTDRGGVVVDASLVARRQLTGLPVAGGGGEACTVPIAEANAFEGNGVACDLLAPGGAPAASAGAHARGAGKTEALPLFIPPFARYDAIAALDTVARDGAVAQVIAARELNGKLRVRRQEPGAARPVEATMEGTGAQLALVDLDLDGVAEVVTTADAGDDLLVVSSFAKGQLVPRLRFHAKEGVRALGVCPPEERGAPGLVAIVGSEVWLVR